MLSVTTRDSPGVNLTAFVDTRDGSVTGLDSFDDVLAFASGEDIPGAEPRGGEGDGADPTAEQTSPEPTTEEPTPSNNENTSGPNPEDLSDEELIELLREAAERLEKEPEQNNNN
jgi:hypothetical protein